MSFLKRLFGKDEPSGEEHGEEQREPEVEQVQREGQQLLHEEDKPSGEEQREEPQEREKDQAQEEEQRLLHELAETRERLFVIEQRKAEYILDEQMPMQFDILENRTRARIAELENRCMALGIEPVEDALATKEHLTRLLAKARENLLLIESRKERHKSEADVPIQLSKAEQRWRARIAELENKIGEE
jgi:hypothetical protein